MCNQLYNNIIQFSTLFMQYIFLGQKPVPLRSGKWILDLSHDPVREIWLSEVSKFHQHHNSVMIRVNSTRFNMVAADAQSRDLNIQSLWA